jgi:hypothetical protein
MKRIIAASGFILLTALFVSCKKDGDKPAATAELTGSWNFISLDVQGTSTEEFNDGSADQKTVTTSIYTTENNTGNLFIDASSMSSNNISYSINTTSSSDYYVNGMFIKSFEVPFSFSAPPSNGSCTYKIINADSIYFENGNVFLSGVSQATIPCGAKLKREGNTLFMTVNLSQSDIQVISGINIQNTVTAVTRIKLQKQ